MAVAREIRFFHGRSIHRPKPHRSISEDGPVVVARAAVAARSRDFTLTGAASVTHRTGTARTVSRARHRAAPGARDAPPVLLAPAPLLDPESAPDLPSCA